MKYIPSIRTSSSLLIWRVNGGGRKKKSQMRALNVAERRIGPMPTKSERIETVKSNPNATI
jgi:hypothetical protein